MTVASVPVVVLLLLLMGFASAALASGLLWRERKHPPHTDLYCRYCGWGLSRTAGYEVYHWLGKVYCSLVCLRRDEALQNREEALP